MKAASNLYLLTLSILISVVCLEAGLRLFGLGNPEFTPRFNEGISCRYHPRLGWSGIPNLRLTNYYGPELGDVKIALNNEGFRDVTHSLAKTKGKQRILFLGDSFTLGFGIPTGHRFSDVIQHSLTGAYEVLNMGLWGYGTDQYLLTLREKGLQYNPDIVICAVYLDDLSTDNAYTRFNGRYIKPKYKLLNDGSLKLTNVPIPNNRSASFLYNFSLSRLLEIRNRLDIGREFYASGFPANVIDKQYYRQGHYQLTLRLIRELSLTAKQAGSKFLLVIIPMEFQMDEAQILKSQSSVFWVPPERLGITLFQRVISEFCHKAGIPVLDLLPGFIIHAEGQRLFFQSDPHFNRQGHKLAADLIMMYLQDKGFIER